jgi:hypothetical protein
MPNVVILSLLVMLVGGRSVVMSAVVMLGNISYAHYGHHAVHKLSLSCCHVCRLFMAGHVVMVIVIPCLLISRIVVIVASLSCYHAVGHAVVGWSY